MGKNSKQALNNAAKIIERFGGIRPMAAKINTPVTTVQGWKKRDVIPGTRRDQILTAASDNNIDLSDLSNGETTNVVSANIANQNDVVAPTEKPSVQPEVLAAKSQSTSKSYAEEMVDASASVSAPKPSSEESHETLMAAIEENSRKTMVMSAWIAIGMILLTAVVAAFLLWPSVKENSDQMISQSKKIESLEGEVNSVSERTSFIDKIVPENMQKKMDELQVQARNIQTTVDQLSDRASDITSGILGADAGPLSQRLTVLEDELSELSGKKSNFGDLIERIRQLETSVSGQEQLKNSMDELRVMVENMDGLSQGLAEIQEGAEGALGQTLGDVSGNELKAAAMLIAFSQLRDSLNREVPFDNDLALLEKLAGNDNPELQEALTRLAPHADGGVLTAAGLAGEFKGLAGDVIVASLKGEKISLKEKAKARLGSLFQVEKEGTLVTGTDTQLTVSKAQNLLDAGNIQAAITELQTLNGGAAESVQPFIAQAEISLLAEKVQQMLGDTIISKMGGQLPISGMLQGMGINIPALDSGAVGTTMQNAGQGSPAGIFNMQQVQDTLENALPFIGDKEVIRDEESGVTILPYQPGFKGLSNGQ